jgi:hypothetical protein
MHAGDGGDGGGGEWCYLRLTQATHRHTVLRTMSFLLPYPLCNQLSQHPPPFTPKPLLLSGRDASPLPRSAAIGDGPFSKAASLAPWRHCVPAEQHTYLLSPCGAASGYQAHRTLSHTHFTFTTQTPAPLTLNQYEPFCGAQSCYTAM